jgi:AmmeMemoRadiSam system protein B/AmmeMemoRadiSam system protein A
MAGNWYPGDPDELKATVDGFLSKVEAVDGEPIGLVVPHAGYQYSGQVAAYGFKQMEGVPYDVAVIISADHQPPISNPISVWAEGGFETPLGVVPVDQPLAKALMEADPQIKFDPAAHEQEHMIEIELPFLQRVCPTCKIVPILMGTEDDKTTQALAEALLSVLPGRRAVIIASSDLAHYPDYQNAIRVDNEVLGAIETGDPARVRSTIDQMMAKGITNLVTCACAEAPILVTMRVAQGLGANTTTVLDRSTSGDQPGGDQSQVVGYGAVMIWRYEPPELNQSQRKELLDLARKSILEQLRSGKLTPFQSNEPVLTRLSGVFVTLKEDGELRGCIGHLQADLPLYQTMQEMAISAAFSDPRFPPLKESEMDRTSLEISILSPFQRITGVDQIEIGKHGLLISEEGREGIFLPEVPVEQGWDLPAYLSNLCYKAGLPDGCWLNADSALYTFTTVAFGDK